MFDEEEEGDVETDDGEYKPHAHRQVPNPISYMESVNHIIKCSLSTGLLAMPNGFSSVGLGAGFLGSVLGGLLVTHCLHALIESQYKQCLRLRVPMLSYQDTISATLAHGHAHFRPCACPLGMAVIVFLLALQLGTCCVIIVFVAQSLKKVVDGVYILSFEAYLIFLVVPCIACNLIEDLKAMAPVSLIANIIIILAFFVYMYVVSVSPRPGTARVRMFNNLIHFPPFFGSLLFSVTSVGVVVAVENEMQTPKEFVSPCGVLNFSMSILIVLHVIIGVMGYNFCRNNCADSLHMDIPQEYWLSHVSTFLFAIGMLLSFGLHCYVPIRLIWGFVEHELPLETPKHKRRVYMLVIRIGLAMFTFLMAIVVPRLNLFISLFGSLCLSALALIFPAVMEASTSPLRRQRIKDYCIIVLGVLIMFLGFYNALDAIVQNFM